MFRRRKDDERYEYRIHIVEQAFQDGYLSPATNCNHLGESVTTCELSIEEFTALNRLMGALLTGDVVA